MTRVSENSSFHAINYSVGKSKSKLENLQLSGSNLKRIQRPSDDPIGNTELLSIRSKNVDSEQYLRNSNYAKTQLTFTENAIEEMTDLVVKAKELAIGQASNLYSPEVRQSVAREVNQLRNQALGIANRRLGNKYIFSGHKTLTRPFDEKGNYFGDEQTTNIEVNKDFFVPINFSGKYIFYEKENNTMQSTPNANPLINTELNSGRELASTENQITDENDMVEQNFEFKGPGRSSVFGDLERLENALITNNHIIIQSVLPKLDTHVDRLVEIRTQIGSTSNSIEKAEENIEKTKLLNAEYTSKIEDADVAKLFTDLTRQQNVMNATYKTSAQLMNKSLLDFIR